VVERITAMEKAPNTTLTVGDTPAVLRALGARALPMQIAPSVIHKAMRPIVKGHDVRLEDMKRLPGLLANPVAVFDSRTTADGALVVFVEAKDSSGRDVVIAVHLDTEGSQFNKVNKIASAYGRQSKDFADWMNNGSLRYYNQEKTSSWLHAYGLQLPAANTIKRLNPNVITESEVVKGDGTLFSRAKVAGDSGRQYSADQQQTFRHIGREIETPTVRERVSGLWKDIGKKLRQGVFDQFAPLKDLDQKAYLLARMSKGSDGALEAMLLHGRVVLNGGVYDANVKDGGVVEKLLQPLGKEVDDFMWWIAGNRAEQLAKDGRENLMSPDDIDALKALANGDLDFDYTLRSGQKTRHRGAAYQDAKQVLNAFNKSMLDVAEQSGLIDGAERKTWESEFYVPFYREAEEGEKRFPSVKQELVRQKAFQRLKGGSDKLNHDLLANTLMNWSHLLNAATKNRAAKAALEAAERAGVAHRLTVPEIMAKQKGDVYFRENGKEIQFTVGDPFIFDAITALEFSGFSGPAMEVMGTFKRYLTMGVTASPTFKIRNLIRDSISAIGQGELSYNLVKNLQQGIAGTNKNSQTYVSLLASGGIIRFGTMLEGNNADRVRNLVKAGVKPETILDSQDKWKALWDGKLKPLWEAYQAEGINRAESALNAQARRIEADRTKTGRQKREELDWIAAQKDRFARSVAGFPGG
jgi:hypothetical protein